MPKSYLTMTERLKAEKQNANNRKYRQLKERLALVKHGVGYEKIRNDTGYSFSTICKIINTPEKATIEQLLSVCSVAGVKVDFVFEQSI